MSGVLSRQSAVSWAGAQGCYESGRVCRLAMNVLHALVLSGALFSVRFVVCSQGQGPSGNGGSGRCPSRWNNPYVYNPVGQWTPYPRTDDTFVWTGGPPKKIQTLTKSEKQCRKYQHGISEIRDWKEYFTRFDATNVELVPDNPGRPDTDHKHRAFDRYYPQAYRSVLLRFILLYRRARQLQETRKGQKRYSVSVQLPWERGLPRPTLAPEPVRSGYISDDEYEPFRPSGNTMVDVFDYRMTSEERGIRQELYYYFDIFNGKEDGKWLAANCTRWANWPAYTDGQTGTRWMVFPIEEIDELAEVCLAAHRAGTCVSDSYRKRLSHARNFLEVILRTKSWSIVKPSEVSPSDESKWGRYGGFTGLRECVLRLAATN